MYVCVYICIYVCMYVYMYVWMDGWMDGWMDAKVLINCFKGLFRIRATLFAYAVCLKIPFSEEAIVFTFFLSCVCFS